MASNEPRRSPSPPPLPPYPLTKAEVYAAIPPAGIKVADFATHFVERAIGEEKFRSLMLLAKQVAHLDLANMLLRRKDRPTNDEVRAAIPAEGISVARLKDILNGPALTSPTKMRISKLLQQIAIVDEAAQTVCLKGKLTAEEILEAIPREGIGARRLQRLFSERVRKMEDHEHFLDVLADVAVWDSDQERFFCAD